MSWSWVRSAWVSVILVVVGSGLALLQLHDDRRAMSDAESRRALVTQQVTEYLNLIGTEQNTLHNTKPQQDVESRITQAIEYAKVSPRPRFRATVQADRDVRRPGTRSAADLREQAVTIQIPGLSIEQIGRILVYWRDQQSVWTPNQIELTHDQRSSTDQYTLHLECVAVYHSTGE